MFMIIPTFDVTFILKTGDAEIKLRVPRTELENLVHILNFNGAIYVNIQLDGWPPEVC